MSEKNPKKRRVKLPEMALALSGIVALGAGMLFAGEHGNYYLDESENIVRLEPRPNPYGVTKKLDPALFNLNAFYNDEPPTVEVSVEPEFISSLNASVPKEQVCKKIRYKKAPVNSITIDGTEIPGENWIRYRGFCYPHWFGEQKSVKLNLGDNYRGYNTLNLNAIATDQYLFEVWANQLMSLSGGLASRVDFAKLYINGEYQGLRFLVENLDWDLLKNQSLARGGVYREMTSAYLGHAQAVERGAYRPYRDVNHIKETWEKNADGQGSWAPFENLQSTIYSSVVEDTDTWKNVVNIDHYINYIAIQVITGTHHQNNHNIPIYQPNPPAVSKQEAVPAIPIGYDFGLAHAAYFNSDIYYGWNAQIYALSQNWLTSLFWTDPELRARIHERVVEIIYDHDPSALYSRIAKRSEELFRGEAGAEKIIGDFPSQQAIIDRRVKFLQDSFTNPKAEVNAGWQTKNQFQMMIDGRGQYRVTLRPKEQSCDEKSVEDITVAIGASKPLVVASCKNGRLVSQPFTAERDDFYRDELNFYYSYLWRQPVGGILTTFSNPSGLELDTITIEPLSIPSRLKRKLHAGEKFEPREIWPFMFEQQALGVFSLGDTAAVRNFKAAGGIIEVLNISEEGKLKFNVKDDSLLEVVSYDINERINLTDYGPFVCWSRADEKSCFELGQRYLYGKPEAPVREAVEDDEQPGIKDKTDKSVMTVSGDAARSCTSDFTFETGTWRIVEGLVFPKECSIRFAGGARLEFADIGYLVALGEVTFPEEGKVDFTGIDGKNWLGTVFKGQKNLHIRNASFSRGSEFLWEGTYFTGAVNVIDVENTHVTASHFFDNDADDGLNIRGGSALVEGNVFARNRDGLDLDLCVATVTHNLFIDQADDGLDLGTAGPITISENIMFNSGDKGISIGEGSETIIADNVLSRNNFGIANKDGSKASLDGNYFYSNAIGISAYNKTLTDATVAGVRGKSFFLDNSADYKIEKGAPKADIVGLFDANSTSRAGMTDAAANLLEQCPSCSSSINLEKLLQ